MSGFYTRRATERTPAHTVHLVRCDCGLFLTKPAIRKHLQSARHLAYVASHDVTYETAAYNHEELRTEAARRGLIPYGVPSTIAELRNAIEASDAEIDAYNADQQ